MESLLTSFISPIWDVIKGLWNCIPSRVGYFSDLQSNVDSLKQGKKRLLMLKEEVEARVTREENQLKQRTYKVRDWLSRVECILKSVDEITDEGEEEIKKKCIRCFFPKNFCSYQEVGKKVRSELEALTQLINEGHFDAVTEIKPHDPVDERPTERIIGLESEFNQVWKCMEDRSVRTIGIYGLGGVGKTTLLKKVNNHFLETSHSFDAVIWVVVSKQVNMERIQEAICNKLAIPDELWRNRNEEDRTGVILKFLTAKNFVLLLDDLWDHLDLLRIGIPPLDRTSGSKVVFTTRSQEVCGFMKADKSIKVECLVPEEALQLFQMKLSQGTLNAHRDIPKLAVMLAECCQGLPLALITVGRAMASRRNLKDWKHALKMLQSYPSEFSGMAKDVFPILKFSYDSLSNDTLRSCFLYCSLFPEDYNIGKDELTELWIREGFLHNFNDIYDARNEGEYIIGSLKHAGLLEEGPTPEDYVRMHDVIRDMALWIASNHEIKIAVVEDAASIKTHGFEEWKEVKRLTLWGKSFKDLNETQHFPCLLTFLVRDTKLISFPSGFFQHMRVLNILDLSRNWNLSELPTGISVLTNLQHLNLSYTRINSLPHEVQYLRNLKSLIMDYTYKLAYIPREVISSLSLLQVFSKMQEVHNKLFDERGLLEELERLKDMEDMSVALTSLDSVEKFFCSPKLESCIRRLWVSMCKDLTSFQISSLRRGAKHLERLEIYRCPLLKEFIVHSDESEMIQGCVPTNIGMGQESFQELRYLKVDKCPGIKDLTWVIYAPNLQTIILDACSSIVEIIADDKLNRWRAEIKENPEVFPNLATLILIRLPKLKSICQQTLGFPSLKILKVVDCPSLKKLPFDSNSAKNTLQAIEAAEDWWNSLQWEEDAKIAFASRFRRCISQDEIEVAKMEAIKLIPELIPELTAAHMDLESKNANAQKITNEKTRELTSVMMKKMPELLMQVTDQLNFWNRRPCM
ncbi:disease resistance protein SUMM2-like [Hevea brasiliensis]|uniref:disease resistance protein SUMM2-like n=1 Tax=Hevea brasiliensis TaxID=3981 RepID=UPI0025D7B439|nr:disease resistance protein SUMM2-like [Hevea brasiliensis]